MTRYQIGGSLSNAIISASNAGSSDPVRRAVKPQGGKLVLFPSYMWHGTVPFHSSQSRTTLAFDAVPK